MDYINRRIVKETAKAYLVEQRVYNRRDGSQINYKWVAKSVCKNFEHKIVCGFDLGKFVDVPEMYVSNGVW